MCIRQRLYSTNMSLSVAQTVFEEHFVQGFQNYFCFISRMNQIRMNFFQNALTPLNHKGHASKNYLLVDFDNSKDALNAMHKSLALQKVMFLIIHHKGGQSILEKVHSDLVHPRDETKIVLKSLDKMLFKSSLCNTLALICAIQPLPNIGEVAASEPHINS